MHKEEMKKLAQCFFDEVKKQCFMSVGNLPAFIIGMVNVN